MKIGYFLSCEEYSPSELIGQAVRAEQAGFESLWISDHFHPWNREQAQSPFVWSVIGALSQVCSLPVTTAVTCPTMRIHPAIIAQAAATASVMLDGKFTLGVGTGEALNETVTGQRFPPEDVRLEMLEEAVSVIRELHAGDVVDHHGKHYTVEQARIFTLLDQPPPIYVSGFGPKSAEVAGRIGDGFLCTKTDPDLIATFRAGGGDGKPMQAGYKVCFSHDADAAARAAHRLWAHSGLPGEAGQLLPSPRHFEQLTGLVTEEMTRDSAVCGDDLAEHVAAIRPFRDLGYDEVYISQMGGRYENIGTDGFFDFYRDEVLPAMRAEMTW